MSPYVVSLIPGLMLACSTLVLWANPRRRANQAAALALLQFTLWIAAREVSIRTEHGLLWFRLSVSIGALSPLLIWVLKASLESASWPEILRRCSLLLGLTIPLAAIPWTEWFIPSYSTREARVYGGGYAFYVASLLVIYTAQTALAIRYQRRSSGSRRLEFQVISLFGSLLGLAVLTLMAVDRVLDDSIPSYVSLVLVILYSGMLTFSLCTNRIFDAQYLFRFAARWVLLTAGVAGVAFGVFFLLSPILPLWIVFASLALAALLISRLLDPALDQLFFRRPLLAAARSAVHQVARSSISEDSLKASLSQIVGGWAQADVTVVSPDTVREEGAPHPDLAVDEPLLEALEQLTWATPERLQRERPSPSRDLVHSYLERHQLGALVVSSSEGTPAVLAIGLRPTRRPFTYPDVQHLIEFAAVTELAVTRVRLIAQAIHADRLATVGVLGASLAHEIRNPLYAIKAFAELLPDHYERPDFRFQFSQMVGDEVLRIDQLISQMMHLASPRKPVFNPLHLNSFIDNSLELVRHKARSSGIVLHAALEADEDEVETDSSLTKQVLLNLCLNAIQVLEKHPDPRWIHVTTRNIPGGVELAVADSGPGIPPKIRPRLFQRFITTSSRGLGLGLSISREIMVALGGTLDADAPIEGQGAVFRAVFPLRTSPTPSPTPAAALPAPAPLAPPSAQA
jgi:signal transduction histidine kinase